MKIYGRTLKKKPEKKYAFALRIYQKKFIEEPRDR
ncbi:hypothetical protein QG37_04710 [Candidozyma auris]|uniref:Uncharacterized protein n=1 Tax=Candidozyma auris TaxID=498019 RepID=A0A0L0NYL8_CANAR|nr:hypothetical protein QG37_04710 [[Candida] auris]